MELIKLGLNGPKVAAVGMGCWAWGDKLFWDYGKTYTKDDLRNVFKASVAAGVNFFDTAELYGLGASERLLGEFIAESGAEVVVASKCFPFPWRITSKQLHGALRYSLRRLGLPHIQLYQMHWPYAPVRVESWMHAMADAVEAGSIKQIGVSNYDTKETERAYRTLEKRGLHLASNQIRYSLLDRSPERTGLLQLCKDLNITVIAYSPIAQGLLTGKYSPQNPPPARRSFGTSSLQQIQPLLDLMRKFGIAHGNKTPSQVAINWCIAQGTLPIPGAKNERQARENAEALGWSLTADEVTALNELT